jgi:hypothetical protein
MVKRLGGEGAKPTKKITPVIATGERPDFAAGRTPKASLSFIFKLFKD